MNFRAVLTAGIISEKCTNCGLCRDLCRFDAISEDYVVDPVACEGCGVCHYFCPEEAVDFSLNTCGEWFLSESRFGPVVHARLGDCRGKLRETGEPCQAGGQETRRGKRPQPDSYGRAPGGWVPCNRIAGGCQFRSHSGRAECVRNA